MYVVCVSFTVIPEHKNAFLNATLKNARESLSREIDCHTFDVCSSDENNEVFLYEIYESRDAFTSHLNTDHFKHYDKCVAELIVVKTVKSYQLVSEQ